MRVGEYRVPRAFAAIFGGALIAALLGCQAKTEAPPEASPEAATEAAMGSTQPITLTWDAQLNCIKFSQGRITIKVGDMIRFNSSVQQVVTLRIPIAAFGSSDTLLTIPLNGSITTAAAKAAGSYNVNSTPAMCATPDGGVGPVIVVEESK